MNRSYIHPYAFTNGLVHKNSVRCSTCIRNTPSGSPLVGNNQTRQIPPFFSFQIHEEESDCFAPRLGCSGWDRKALGFVLVIWFHNCLWLFLGLQTGGVVGSCSSKKAF